LKVQKISITVTNHAYKYINDNYKYCIYLDNKFDILNELKNSSCNLVEIEDKFNYYLDRYKDSILDLYSKITNSNDPIVWASGQVASKSTTASNIVRNIIYFFFLKEYLDRTEEDVLICCNNYELMQFIVIYYKKQNITIKKKLGILNSFKYKTKYIIKPVYSVVRFLLLFLVSRLFYLESRSSLLRIKKKENILIRSWQTRATFENKKYSDRNFGILGESLKKKKYSVSMIPMIFNPGVNYYKQCKHFYSLDENFLLPTNICNLREYFFIIYTEIARFLVGFENLFLDGIDFRYFFEIENKNNSFSLDLMVLNLIYPTLQILNKKNIKFEKFIYPFESNAPEKMFILGKKKYYNDTIIIGYQHTILISDQLSLMYKDIQNEILPDKIITSGTECKRILQELKLPINLLDIGPSLRFNHILSYQTKKVQKKQHLNIFAIALPFNQNLAEQEIIMISSALKDFKYILWVKVHPLLNKEKIINTITSNNIGRYKIVDMPCYELFQSADIAFEIGASITQLEAVVCGVPVVRIVPSSDFHYDPMHWMNYPVKIARNTNEIKNSVKKALSLEAEELKNYSEYIKENYFNKVTDETLKVFLKERGEV